MRLVRPPVWSAFFLVLVILHAGGCSSTPQTQPATDFSNLSPTALLDEFLDTENSRGAVRFNFRGELEVQSGKTHRFRGFGGYDDCESLRLQLLGPLGFTMLDYLNVGGEATLIANKLTPQGDQEARAGLLQLMQAFTAALVDRCYSQHDVRPGAYDLIDSNYSASTHAGVSVEFTLERSTAAVRRQALAGKGLPDTSVYYLDYGRVENFWMPGKIEVRTADLPVSIDMSIKEWKFGVVLPDGFFTVE